MLRNCSCSSYSRPIRNHVPTPKRMTRAVTSAAMMRYLVCMDREGSGGEEGRFPSE